MFSKICFVTSLNAKTSSGENLSNSIESISRSATTSLFCIIGITSSLLVALSQAMCPGN